MNKEKIYEALEEIIKMKEEQKRVWEWTNVAISTQIGIIRQELRASASHTALNLASDIDTLYGDSHNPMHTRYDVHNTELKTVEGAVYGDRPSIVYVKTVGDVPVHDTIEIRKVDVNGYAYTHEGHGVQARDGKWYERLAPSEWELVIQTAGNKS